METFHGSTVVVAEQILNVTVDNKRDIHDEKGETNFSVQFKPHASKNRECDEENEKQNETKLDVRYHHKTS